VSPSLNEEGQYFSCGAATLSYFYNIGYGEWKKIDDIKTPEEFQKLIDDWVKQNKRSAVRLVTALTTSDQEEWHPALKNAGFHLIARSARNHSEGYQYLWGWWSEEGFNGADNPVLIGEGEEAEKPKVVRKKSVLSRLRKKSGG